MMKVTKYIENEDGSANIEVEMDAEETRQMIELGIITCLKLGIEREKISNMSTPDCCGGECEGNCDCTCVPSDKIITEDNITPEDFDDICDRR